MVDIFLSGAIAMLIIFYFLDRMATKSKTAYDKLKTEQTAFNNNQK